MSNVRRFTIACFTVCVSVVAGCQLPPPASPAPGQPDLRLTVPAKFTINPYQSPILLFYVEVENFGTTSSDPIALQLRDSTGKPVEVQFTNPLTVFQAATGRGRVGIDLAQSAIPNGAYQVCAHLKALDRCEPVQIDKALPTDCEKAFEKLKAKIGCRCAGGMVKVGSAEAPDGTLGKFVPGGNTMGVFDTTSNAKTGPTFSSLAKFEAHFTVGIIDDPGVPDKCTEAEWQRLTISLCTEGQEINYTHHETVAGTETTTDNTVGGTNYKFDKRKEAAFAPDGWGYRRPSPTTPAPQVIGPIKAHDAPDIVHWLDAPGIYNGSSATWKAKLPAHDDNYFHTFVHGTTGKKEDNCDCYHYVKDIALDADGAVSPVLEAANCGP